jgi:hypothetical protein
MSKRADHRRESNGSFLSTLRGKALAALVTVIVVLLLSFVLSLVATSIFHAFGNGFVLTDDRIVTSVIVRNDSPFPFPGVQLSYSYDARIVDGNAQCELPTAEGIKPCGSVKVDLGAIKPSEPKKGSVIVLPSHGNFTIEYRAYVWILTCTWEVASVSVSCTTNDGANYTCARTTGPSETPTPPPIPGFPFESIIVGFLLGIVMVISRIKRSRTRHI